MSRRETLREANLALSAVWRGAEAVSFFCECDQPDCAARIEMAAEDYLTTHLHPGCYLVDAHHEVRRGSVLMSDPRFAVVRESMWARRDERVPAR